MPAHASFLMRHTRWALLCLQLAQQLARQLEDKESAWRSKQQRLEVRLREALASLGANEEKHAKAVATLQAKHAEAVARLEAEAANAANAATRELHEAVARAVDEERRCAACNLLALRVMVSDLESHDESLRRLLGEARAGADARADAAAHEAERAREDARAQAASAAASVEAARLAESARALAEEECARALAEAAEAKQSAAAAEEAAMEASSAAAALTTEWLPPIAAAELAEQAKASAASATEALAACKSLKLSLGVADEEVARACDEATVARETAQAATRQSAELAGICEREIHQFEAQFELQEERQAEHARAARAEAQLRVADLEAALEAAVNESYQANGRARTAKLWHRAGMLAMRQVVAAAALRAGKLGSGGAVDDALSSERAERAAERSASLAAVGALEAEKSALLAQVATLQSSASATALATRLATAAVVHAAAQCTSTPSKFRQETRLESWPMAPQQQPAKASKGSGKRQKRPGCFALALQGCRRAQVKVAPGEDE